MTEQRLPSSDMNSTSPLSSSLVASRRPELGAGNIPMYHREQPTALQHQIFQLKQQQQMQQQILLQQFHAQQQQLAEQHQKQLQDILEHQKKVEEEARVERERLDKERLQALKNKEKREQSAVASSEVKQKLQEFVLSKKQREAAAAAANGLPAGSSGLSSPQYRAWTGAVPTLPVPGGQKPAQPPLQLPGPGPGTSGGGMSHPLTGVHHYRHPLLPGSYDEDYRSLRKTVSEPNLLKMPIRHRMQNRRNDPIMGKRGAHGRHVPQTIIPVHPSAIAAPKRMSQLASETEGSTPDSGASSPLNSHSLTNPSTSTVPISERDSSPQYNHLLASQGSISDLSLYSSPSLPNISLGRPAATNPSAETSALAIVNESDVRAALAARMGLPLSNHLLHGGMPPYYPLPPTLDGSEYGNNLESSAFIPKQMQFLEQSTGHSQMLLSGLYPGAPITDSQVAHARLNKSGLRPLGRTQSAPLPLGHPVLHGTQVPPAAMGLTQQQFEQYVRDRQVYEQQQQHNLLKQQIRQTVLTRVGSRSQVENVEEETEAAVAREMSRDRGSLPEVIDLTEHKVEDEDNRSTQFPTAMDDRDNSRDGLPPVPHRILIGNRPTLQTGTNSAFTARSHHVARPLSRAFSSPLVSLNPAGASTEGLVEPTTLVSAGWITSAIGAKQGSTNTGLAYDVIMLRHQCSCGNNDAHPENAGRLQSIMARLAETGLSQRCMRLRSRKATLEEIQSVHTEAYTELFGTSSINKPRIDESLFAELPMKGFMRLSCGGLGADSDTTWNDIHTPYAARMAAGCVIDLAVKVATGEIRNGFAVVRPPGHHAESQQAMGFCYFNSVAIAAKQLRMKHKLERILIIDWDVHHGNGTQHVFYNDPHILYISVHRHDKGDFFPGSGSPLECGADEGIGFNVNVAWSGGLDPPLGDAEYLAAFRTLVMPIAQDFDPEIVLVSAGFDAAAGHPRALGGYEVSAACFGYMTRQLMQLAGGKVILALEGGYDIPAICDATYECVRALLGDECTAIRPEELGRRPCQNAIKTLQECIAIQSQYWPAVKRFAFSVDLSAYEAERINRGEVGGEGDDSETLTAMAGLSVCRTNSNNSLSTSTVSREPSQEPMDQDESK